jgi:uncharacterized damage-inducible protein DinB
VKQDSLPNAAMRLRSDLRASRARLYAPLRGLTEERFRIATGDEAWPIAAYLAHLLRTERVFTERAQLAMREEEPSVPSTRVENDEDPGLAQRMAVPQMIHGLQAVRRELEELLLAADDAALERALIHERLGRMTVAELAAKMAAHEDEHAADVARVAASLPSTKRTIIPLTPQP